MNTLHNPISRREIEVLSLIASGYTMNEIGEILFISKHTSISHKRQLLNKLNARNCAHLVSIAYEKGLISLSVDYLFPSLLKLA